MILDYINRNKYNVNHDYKQEQKKDLVYKYKMALLKANNHEALAELLYNKAPQFYNVTEKEDYFDESLYPVSLEIEKNEIEKRVRNLEYLDKAYQTFEYCRTRCKINKMQNMNLVTYPQENQMCLSDCLNIRFEKFGVEKPTDKDKEGNIVDSDKKTFIWLA